MDKRPPAWVNAALALVWSAAAILVFAHTVGEFGVVLMIGGAIPGSTAVLSVEIYKAVESLEWARAHVLSALLFVFGFVVVLSLLRLERRLAGGRIL